MVKERTKIITLTFYREQLLYDIKNAAYVEGDMLSEDIHGRHQVMDIGEEGNVDRVTRILDISFSSCVESCYPYTKIPVVAEDVGMVTDDTLRDSESYVMRLLVPDDFSQTTVTYITRLVHELMVCRVLADWLGITNPQSAARWDEKATVTETELLSVLNARCGRVRRTLTSF